MTTRSRAKKLTPLPSYKLLMPSAGGGTALAAHVEAGKTIHRDDALVSRFRLRDYCVSSNVACTPDGVQAIQEAAEGGGDTVPSVDDSPEEANH